MNYKHSNSFVKNLKSKNIWFKLHLGNKDLSTAVSTSKHLNIPLEKIAKTIVMVDENNKPLIVILPGKSRIKTKFVKKVLGLKDVRLALPDEVKKFTRFEVGEIPPIFHGIKRTIVDIELLKSEVVFAGGGARNAIIEMKVKDIIKLNNAIIAKVSE